MKTALSHDPAIPHLDELVRLRLHNLVLQQLLCREQLNISIQHFLQTPQPKTLQDKIDDLTKQINNLAAEIYAETKVDPRTFQLNVETGLFVERNENKHDHVEK